MENQDYDEPEEEEEQFFKGIQHLFFAYFHYMFNTANNCLKMIITETIEQLSWCTLIIYLKTLQCYVYNFNLNLFHTNSHIYGKGNEVLHTTL